MEPMPIGQARITLENVILFGVNFALSEATGNRGSANPA
jgi:hypothetical protein